MKNEEEEVISEFDKSEAVKQNIQPLIDELEKTCLMYGVPMFVACCIKNSEKSSDYVKRAVFADTLGILLKDDYIKKFLSITLGFDTIYRSKSLEGIDFEDDEDSGKLITADDNE